MTAKRSKRLALDVVVCPAASLMENGRLGTVQRLLMRHAPKWSERARTWRSKTDHEPANLGDPSVLEAALRRTHDRVQSSPMAKALAAQRAAGKAPRGPRPRFVAGTELRSADDALTVIVRADEFVLKPSAGRWLFGNRVTLQIRRPRVEGTDAAIWSAGVFEALCAELSPLWGAAYTSDEYDMKNMSRADGGLRAVGVDASRHLPGLYWLNFFGRPYCDLIGQRHLLSAPAPEVREVDTGVLLRLAQDPRDWSTPAYKEAEARVLDHVGDRYFFSIQEPDRRTVAPPFELP